MRVVVANVAVQIHPVCPASFFLGESGMLAGTYGLSSPQLRVALNAHRLGLCGTVVLYLGTVLPFPHVSNKVNYVLYVKAHRNMKKDFMVYAYYSYRRFCSKEMLCSYISCLYQHDSISTHRLVK